MPVEKPTDWVNSIVLSKTTNSKGEITKLRVLDGITGMADDMFVYGSSEEEHDRNLIKLMQRAQEKGIVFNKDRSQFKCKEVSFFEHSWSSQGIRPDNKKVSAILDMQLPNDVKNLRSFLGLVSYLTRYS